MIWIAPSENDAAPTASEMRLGGAAHQFAAKSCLKSQEFSVPVLGLVFLRFAAQRAKLLAAIAPILLLLCGCPSPASKATPLTTYNVQELGVIKDVLPMVVQPDRAKWQQLQVGMTEDEVTALLGNPYRKNARPTADTTPNVRQLYSWYYGEISFQSFTTKGAYDYTATFHEGRVKEINDPWKGKLSPDGQPTVPELVMPAAGQTLHHYPRFLDFRWHPSAGVYPMEYEVVIQVLSVDQDESEHYENYIQKTVDSNRAQWQADGMTPKAMEDLAASFAQGLREGEGVQQTFQFRTHDIYLPFTWVGANTGRWRIRGTNEKGASEWTAWRYFKFST